MLHIRLLGGFAIAEDDTPLVGLHLPRVQALFAYLLLHCQAPQSRHQLAFRFWPDSSEKQAHTNLRKLLYQLRNALPDPDRFLIQDHLIVQWRPNAPFSLDVAEVQELLAQPQTTSDPVSLARIVQLYQGELLPACYDDWILPIRQQLQREVMSALEQLINLSEHQREYRAGLSYAQRLLGLDPLHEGAYRRMMQLHALNGDRAAALHDYHTCATLLKQELGVEPDEETVALYQRILNQTGQPPQPAAPPFDAPLVGRKGEWRSMLAAWRQAQRGQAHFVSLSGEAGIGKTRLAEELLTWASTQGFRVARSRSYEAEGGLAYAPVTEWLRASPLESALAKLDKGWLGEIARLLPELLNEHTELAPPAPLTEAWQRQRFFEALARATLADNSPLLLVIDDLQWCDTETLSWLRFLLRYEPHARLLIVGTWRSEAVAESHPLQTLLRDLHNANQLTTLDLSALSAQETAELAQHIVARPIAVSEMQQLYQVTEGHPLFVVETLRTLGDWRTSDGDRVDDSAGQSSLSKPQSLPPKVQRTIQARLAQLSNEARELAGLAAIVGRRFTFSVIAHASQRDEDTLVRALDELWQRRIVREQGADAYDFSHDRIREVAYQGLSQVRCRLYHRRVADALEALAADNLDEVSAQLAVHYEHAAILDKAAFYWSHAGKRAVASYAQRAAIHALSRALDLLAAGDHEQRYDLLLTRVKVYNHEGMRVEGRRDLGALQALARILDDRTQPAIRRQAEVALCAADFYRGLGDRAMARAAAQEAALAAEQCGCEGLAAQAYFLWGEAELGGVDTFAQARPRLGKALTLARAVGLQQTEAEVLSVLALHSIYSGAPLHQIEAELQQSLATYQQLGDPAGQAGALGMLAYSIYSQREGNYDLGIRYCEQALQMVTSGWDAERFALGNLGCLWCYQGDYRRAKPYLERELAITQQVRNWGSEAGAHLDLGYLHLNRGDFVRAQLHLENSLQLFREHDSRQQYRVKTEGLLALLYHTMGENARASTHAEAAVYFARQLDDPRVLGDAFTSCGRVLVSQGKLDEAAELFRQAFSCFRQMEQHNHALMPLAGLAEIALRQAFPAQARAWLERILAHLQTQQLDRTDEELFVYMTCYRVLRALQDERSIALLRLAHEQLQVRAASLDTDNEREMFWSAPPHAEVLTEATLFSIPSNA